jgi:formylglycine-generating enzyme required for sulfatase activity
MSGILHAQHFNINSFKKDAADPSASMYSVRHFNGDYCALIKVMTNAENLTFETTPDLEKFERKKDGEFWVYVPPGIKRIIIRKKGFIPKEFVIPSDIKVESKVTYVMELIGKAGDLKEEAPEPEFVVLKSDPEGASVYIKNSVNDKFEYKGLTPFSTPLFEGEYEFKLEKEMYKPYLGTITVKVGDTKQESISLISNFGSINITSSPEHGGLILLDGKNTGYKTPYTLEPVSVGSHIITVQKDMFEPGKKDVEISVGDKLNVNVNIKPIFGTVDILVDKKSDILIDNVKVGTGNYKGRLVKGLHVIEVEKEGCYSEKQNLTVSNGQNYPLSFSLKSKVGVLSVNTMPLETEIYLDNVLQGKSPKFIKDLQVGTYVMKLEKTGFGVVTKIIEITEDNTTEINETLPVGKEITINSAPTGADLYINGSKVGVTPYITTQSYGDHALRLVNGEKTVEENITISQTGKTSWNFDVSELDSFTETAKGLNMDFIAVVGGTFTMGCTSEDGDCVGNEKPLHNVTLDDFYIGKYEVTQAQWREVMGFNPCRFKDCDECPVEQVSWNNIQKFIKKLNELTGKNYRLPTEAEWEYAARGGNKSRGYKYSGGNTIGDVGWYRINSNNKTHPVGQKQANELGIHDMTGNVYEWCSDWYGKKYYSNSPQQNPQGPTKGSKRVLRGSTYKFGANNCRVANRRYAIPSDLFSVNGFRLVLLKVQ